MAELMAAYSPPIPNPVRNRNRKNHHGAKDSAVSAVAARYVPRVIMKSFLRPYRSVSQPKNSAPTHAPATYMAAPNPVICPWVMSMPLPGLLICPEMFPTMVTSRPSRIQTVPSPIMIIQCHRDHGSRSSRAGTLVVTVPVWTSLTVVLLVSAACGRRPALTEPPAASPRYPVTAVLLGRHREATAC
jgi:hypothetical protein